MVFDLEAHRIKVRLLSYVGIDGKRKRNVVDALADFVWATGCELEVEFCTQHQGLPFVRSDLALSSPRRVSTGGKDYLCLQNHIPVLIDDSIDNVRGARAIGVKTYCVGASAFRDFRHAANELIYDAADRRAQFLDFHLSQPSEATDKEKKRHLRQSQNKIVSCYNCQGNHKVRDCPNNRRSW